jgi:hypothetical protein
LLYKNEIKKRLSYVFIREEKLKDFNGSKPMSINWELEEPMPHYLWKDAAKLSIG